MLDEIIGAHPAIKRFRRQLPLIANSSTPLLFIGETGVGKTFLATHVHAAGPMGNVPLESLNCANLSERDQRVGLFGGEPPVLTTWRRGILELKTTVILKHLDCASAFIQDIVANSLMTSTVYRPSSSKQIPLSAKVIFTFRSPIPELELKKRLSPKLLHLLNPLKRIHIPSLRKRREDIPLLTRHHALKCFHKYDTLGDVSIRGIDRNGSMDSDLLDLLKSQHWEENIRELQAFLRTLVLLPFKEELLEREKLELAMMMMMIEAGQEFSLPSRLARAERSLVERAVKKLNRHKVKVAQLLGISHRAFTRKMGL